MSSLFEFKKGKKKFQPINALEKKFPRLLPPSPRLPPPLRLLSKQMLDVDEKKKRGEAIERRICRIDSIIIYGDCVGLLPACSPFPLFSPFCVDFSFRRNFFFSNAFCFFGFFFFVIVPTCVIRVDFGVEKCENS